jgi:hypothetical protein
VLCTCADGGVWLGVRKNAAYPGHTVSCWPPVLRVCCRLQELWQACVSFAASPEVQLQVFNSAAYAAMWRDSANTAQAFTAQVRVVPAAMLIWWSDRASTSKNVSRLLACRT